MSSPLRLALCQMNATVGDLAGNSERIAMGLRDAREAGAELVLFPELALTGYPPEDLLLREHFLADARTHLDGLAKLAHGIVAIVGFPERVADGRLYNSAAVLNAGVVHAVYRKVHLPNYGVFDEQRYFTSGEGGLVINPSALLQRGADAAQAPVAGVTVGLTVCEDLWIEGPPTRSPAREETAVGARLIVNISASPYHAGKGLQRERLFAERARECDAHVAFCAMVGGQDELVFDGHSFVLDPHGEPVARARQFVEELLVYDLYEPDRSAPSMPSMPSVPSVPSMPRPAPPPSAPPPREPIATLEQEVYEALMLGLHDYVEKNGFGEVVLGLSGGIDSALVACLACDALGSERVHVAVMPSRFSSSATQDDARALAGALGVHAHEFAIEPAMESYTHLLSADFEGRESDLTEENLQARIRGNLLMALSNKFGRLVLTTGNKSEMAVGYTTLYGDLAGGFAVIKDVPKTLVYRLASWRNSAAASAALGDEATPGPIPSSIIERAPSAELRAEQTDQDSLPPYDVLDRILHGYIELDLSPEQLIEQGLPAEDVHHAVRLVDLAEYKRRQAPPGIKITERAFGRDRRMPITNAYRG